VEAEIRDADLGGGKLRVAGVYVDVLAKVVGALPDADLVDAVCGDGYRSPLPAEYVAAHRPILVLKIDGMRPGEWARREHKDDPGPYLIEYENFVPEFRVLAHLDRAQVPWDVVRLDFASQAETFGAITPRGSFAEGSPEMEGFAIAKQNCLRCHSLGRFGGTKAGKSWTALGGIAERRPEWFAVYVRDPKAVDADAKMPGNPVYDGATTAALTAYFRTFAGPAAVQGRMAGGDSARGRRP
jgi:mono/diheme cytochrome c family protein